MGIATNIKGINIDDGICHLDADLWGGYSTSKIKNINGVPVIGDGDKDIDILESMISITYEDLVNTRDAGGLIPGRQYRIIDYETTTSQENTFSAGHKFDIIVTAISENKLSEEARAIQNKDDDYFNDCNLSAWKIWYCLDNDIDRFSWADSIRLGKNYLNSGKINTGDCNIFVPYSFDEEVGLYELDNWIKVKASMINDPSEGNFYEGFGQVNELISHFGYEEFDGESQLTIYARNIEGDLNDEYGEWLDDGLNLSQKYHYMGSEYVDGEPCDLWARVCYDSGEYFEQSGQIIYTLTEKIVRGKPKKLYKGLPYKIELNRKGVIYRMIDEHGNDCPYDFKNIMFDRYELDTPDIFIAANKYEKYMEQSYKNIISGFSSNINSYMWSCVNVPDRFFCNGISSYTTYNKKRFFTFSQIIDGEIFDATISKRAKFNKIGIRTEDEKVSKLSNNIYIISNSECYNNIIGDNCYNNTFDDNCNNNTFENGCANNIFGFGCSNNILSANCCHIIFCNDCYCNTFGSDCLNITLGDRSYNNVFNKFCIFNSLGVDANNNNFGIGCQENTFNDGCNNNTFGIACMNNILYGSFDNMLGDNCINNTIYEGCFGNTLCKNCGNNIFEKKCHDNIIKEYSSDNKFGEECSYNILGISNDNNKFGKKCYNNIFDNSCYNNIFEDGCYSITFGIHCGFIELGSNCYNNTFGNNCHNIKFKYYCKIDSKNNRNICIENVCFGNNIYQFIIKRNVPGTFDLNSFKLRNIIVSSDICGTIMTPLEFFVNASYGSDYEKYIVKRSDNSVASCCLADYIYM